MAIPSNVIVLWTGTNASIPAGWSRETSLDAKYPKGTAAGVDPGTTGGSLTHTHAFTHTHTAAHTHTIPTSSAGTGTTTRDTGTVRPPIAHTHTSGDAQNPATALASDNPTSGTVNNEPAFFETIFIKSDGTPTGIPVNAVALWNSTTGPTGWNLCDAGAGRPDMRAVFLKGAAAAGDGGGTGGAATHSGHTIPSHTHGTNFSHAHPNVTSAATAAAMVGGPVSGANAATATQTHTHVITVVTQATDAITGTTDTASGSGGNEPPYVLQGFIQNNNAGADIPDKIIALWVGTLATIPTNWALMDGAGTTTDLRGQYVKGATTLAGVGGTGGSTTHTHTVTNHTHAVAAHTHTLTHAAGAGSNETAGAVNCSTDTHTHTWGPTGSSSFTSGSGSPTSVDNNTTTEPPFSTVAFIQFTAPPPVIDPQTQRGPVHTKLSRLASILGITVVAANLLPTLLAPTAAPFVQRDWPIQPKLAQLRPADQTPNTLLRLPPGSLPPGQRAWPELQPLHQLATSIPANLFGTLLAPTTAPFNQRDWPIQPKLARLREADATRNVLLTLPPGSLPFTQEDWPTLRRAQGVSVTDSRNLLTTVLATADLPFGPDSWPIQPKPTALQPADATRNLLLALPPGSLPLNQQSWPSPQPLGRVSAYAPPNLFETLLAPTTAPFHQNDWPRVPLSANRIAPKHSAFRLSFGPPAPEQPPFNQALWPKLQRLPDLSYELFYLNLSIGTGAPFSQTDWPIPLKRTLLRPTDATRNLLLTLPPGALPLNQDDWPRPQVLRQRSLAVDPPNLFETLFAPTAFPFIQNYWPIQPKLTILRPTDETVNALSNLPPGRLAFSQTSWPIQPRHPVQRLADAPRNITINLPPPQLAAGGIKHKRKWRRT